MKPELIPVHILSGFLGTGKTTLLNQLLKQPEFANTLVIVNELGEVPLDHFLIESSAETIVELSNGCLCCSIRGELVDTLLSLDTRRFERIFIETTGIADPLPVHQALTAQPILATGMHAGSILTVFDATRGCELVNQHIEAAHQLALADVIYLSMADKIAETTGAAEYVRQRNSTAKVVGSPSEINPDLLNSGIGAEKKSSRTGHGGQYASAILETDTALPMAAVFGFLNHLACICGPSLLRLKGLVRIAERDHAPLLVQMSGQIVHEPVALDDWPSPGRNTQLVVITQDFDTKVVQSVFNSFFGIADVDTPDRTALTENPLAIPGFQHYPD